MCPLPPLPSQSRTVQTSLKPCVAVNVLEPLILWPPSLKGWDYRFVSITHHAWFRNLFFFKLFFIWNKKPKNSLLSKVKPGWKKRTQQPGGGVGPCRRWGAQGVWPRRWPYIPKSSVSSIKQSSSCEISKKKNPTFEKCVFGRFHIFTWWMYVFFFICFVDRFLWRQVFSV